MCGILCKCKNYIMSCFQIKEVNIDDILDVFDIKEENTDKKENVV